MSVLVLFDIDGTLIHAAGAGISGMNRAFGELYDLPHAASSVEIAGRTDRAIVVSAFEQHGLPATDATVFGLRDRYLTLLPEEMRRASARPQFGVLPGAREAADRISRDPRCVSALLTGNFERAAETKLGYFGLWSGFRLGAFGDHHVNRNDLVAVALARAAARDIVVDRVVVIGDTPLDVACARANGALAVAVTTGPYDAATLMAAGADLVLVSLEALDADVLVGA